MILSKLERLAVFLARLQRCMPASNSAAAYALVTRELDNVENELSETPANPQLRETDGRLYPPQADSAIEVPDRNDLKRYRSRRHNTWIGANGAIRIEDLDGVLLLSKPGSDGIEIEL
jgi:hypothetical protein